MKGGIHRAASVDRYQLVTSSLCMDINEMPYKVFHRLKQTNQKLVALSTGMHPNGKEIIVHRSYSIFQLTRYGPYIFNSQHLLVNSYHKVIFIVAFSSVLCLACLFYCSSANWFISLHSIANIETFNSLNSS